MGEIHAGVTMFVFLFMLLCLIEVFTTDDADTKRSAKDTAFQSAVFLAICLSICFVVYLTTGKMFFIN